MNAPLGKTPGGYTVWALPRQPGQETGLRHLTWGGPGHHVHLTAGGVRDEAGQEFTGQVQSEISGSCTTQNEAQAAVDAYITGLGVTASAYEWRDLIDDDQL